MSGFSDFSLGSSTPLLSAGKSRWKPEKGKYRVSFVSLPVLRITTLTSTPLLPSSRVVVAST